MDQKLPLGTLKDGLTTPIEEMQLDPEMIHWKTLLALPISIGWLFHSCIFQKKKRSLLHSTAVSWIEPHCLPVSEANGCYVVGQFQSGGRRETKRMIHLDRRAFSIPKLRINGCLQGLGHLHGPTFHSICGNLMIAIDLELRPMTGTKGSKRSMREIE